MGQKTSTAEYTELEPTSAEQKTSTAEQKPTSAEQTGQKTSTVEPTRAEQKGLEPTRAELMEQKPLAETGTLNIWKWQIECEETLDGQR